MSSHRAQKRSSRLLVGATLCVALLLSVATVAVAATPGIYHGTTSQNLPIVIKLTRTRMASAAYKAQFVCKAQNGETSNLVTTTQFPSAPIMHQKIDKVFHLYHGSSLALLVVKSQKRHFYWRVPRGIPIQGRGPMRQRHRVFYADALSHLRVMML